ncbi:Glutamate receptor 2.7 [Glycine soja]
MHNNIHVIILGITAANESSEVEGIIGAILDSSSRIGQEHSVAINLALEDFNIKNNLSFALHVRNSQGDPLLAAIAARDLIDNQKVQAIIGPQTWAETSLVAEVCTQKSIPLLSQADATPEWAMKKWPFLLQSSPSQIMQMKAIAEIVKSWKLYNITMICEDGDSSSIEVLSQLSGALKEVGTELSNVIAILPLVSSSLSQQLEKLREGQCRVLIVHLSFPLALHLFETAKRMDMMGEGNVWITTGTFTSLVYSLNASTISNMQGIIGVKSYIQSLWYQNANFYHRFRKNFSSENFEEFNYEPGIFAAQAYDVAWIVVDAMRKTNQKGGQLLLDKILLSNFTGLSGTIQFTDNKLTPAHTFQIINVIGRSYREIGFWSDGLGFSKSLEQNAFYSSTVKELGKVVNPTCAIRLRIGVPSTSTFKQYVNVIQEDSGNDTSFKFEGFAIDLFEETVKKLQGIYHVEYDYLPFNGTTYDELVKKVYWKEYDAVVGDVAIVSTRYEYVSFTQPYTDPGVVMIVPVKSKTGNRAWLFLKPFTKLMWVLILVIIVYNGFVVWLIERKHCAELKGPILHQTTTMLWLAFCSLFSVNGRLHSNLSRVATVVWLFVALIITQTYTASLASMLTVEQFEPTVDSIQQLKNSNAMVGYDRGSYLKIYLQDVLGIKAENIKQFDSQKSYADALRNKEIAAAFLDIPEAKIFLAKNCKGFVQAGPTYKIGGYGFVFPKGSPLLHSVNQALLNISENGTLRNLENNMLASEECEDITDPNVETTSLSPASFMRTMWSLMMAVIQSWRSQKRLFSRRVHNVAENNESSDVKGIIGAILDSSSRIGQEHAVAINLALEDFHQKNNLSFALHVRNSQGDPLLAATAARDLIDNQKVQAIIGPQTWAETSLVAEMKAIAEIVKSWKLYNVSMIYEDGDSSSTEVLSRLSEALTSVGTELSNVLTVPPLVSSSLSQQLEKLREGQCRVLIVHLSFPLALHLFETAKRMDMMGEGNVWITTGTFTSLVHSLNASTISNMQGVIGVKSYIPKLWHQYGNFYHRFRKKFSSENFEEFNYEPGIFATEAYDAATIVVDSMRKTNKKGGQFLLDKILRSNFTGLSGQIQFNGHERAPKHTFQIINVIGSSYREIGFWSDGLGFSKSLDPNASYSSSVKELGKVVNPTCDIRLRIGVPSMSIFKQYANVIQDHSENVTSFKGFAIDLFYETVKKLPYHLEYDYFAFNGTYDELVKQVYLKNYDAVVGDVTIVSTRYEYASFTQPFTDTGLVMVVPVKSKTGGRTWLFMKPFTKLMWILILIYTASLASMLIVEQFEPTVDSIQQLKNNNAIVGCDRGSYLQRYLQDALGINAENIKQFDSQESHANALRNKKIAAVFLDVPGAKIFLAKYCKGFVQAGPIYKLGGYGFVFPRGSPLLPGVNQALLNISESGTLRDLENSMLASEKCKDIIDPGAETTSLSPASFMVLFILTGGTSTTALLIYIFSESYLWPGQRTMWSLMMAVIKHWRSQKRLFSRRVHNVAKKCGY